MTPGVVVESLAVMLVAPKDPILVRTTKRSLHSLGSIMPLPLPAIRWLVATTRLGARVGSSLAHHVPQSPGRVLRAHSCVIHKDSSTGSAVTLAKSPQRPPK